MPRRPLSGLQKEVLGLYRSILREAAKKDAGGRYVALWSEPTSTSSYARQEFRKQAALIKRNDYKTIEHKIRYGYKQVKLLQMPGVKVVGGA